jgi:hypothetical protein
VTSRQPRRLVVFVRACARNRLELLLVIGIEFDADQAGWLLQAGQALDVSP